MAASSSLTCIQDAGLEYDCSNISRLPMNTEILNGIVLQFRADFKDKSIPDVYNLLKAFVPLNLHENFFDVSLFKRRYQQLETKWKGSFYKMSKHTLKRINFLNQRFNVCKPAAKPDQITPRKQVLHQQINELNDSLVEITSELESSKEDLAALEQVCLFNFVLNEWFIFNLFTISLISV
jgi:hypothetical protein